MYAEILRALYGDLEALWGIWRLAAAAASGVWRLAAGGCRAADRGRKKAARREPDGECG